WGARPRFPGSSRVRPPVTPAAARHPWPPIGGSPRAPSHLKFGGLNGNVTAYGRLSGHGTGARVHGTPVLVQSHSPVSRLPEHVHSINEADLPRRVGHG